MLLARCAVSLMLATHRVLLLRLVVGIIAAVRGLALVVAVVRVVVRVLVDGAQRGGEHLAVLLLVALPQLMLAKQLGGGPVGGGEVVAKAGGRVLVLPLLLVMVANCLAVNPLLFQVRLVAGGVCRLGLRRTRDLHLYSRRLQILGKRVLVEL